MLSLGEKMFILVTKNNYSLQQMYSPESNTSNTSQGLLLMCEKGTKNSPKQTTETVNMNFFIINRYTKIFQDVDIIRCTYFFGQ